MYLQNENIIDNYNILIFSSPIFGTYDKVSMTSFKIVIIKHRILLNRGPISELNRLLDYVFLMDDWI